MRDDVLAICELPCFEQCSSEGKFYHLGVKKELESKAEGQLYTGQQDALYHGNNVCVFVGLWWLSSGCFGNSSAFVFSAAVL